MNSYKKYSIGEVSKLLDISVQTIRYYQSEKLIEPAYVDEKTNYRYYDDGNIYTLFNIKNLRESGFRVDDIKKIMNEEMASKIDIFSEKILNLEEKINREKKLLKILKNKRTSFNMAVDVSDFSEVEILHLGNRYGQFIESTDDISLYEHIRNIIHVEKTANNDPESSFIPSRIMIRENTEYFLCGLMAIYENNDPTDYNRILQAGKYLSILVKGVGKTEKAYARLHDFAYAHNISISDEAIELLLVDDDHIVGYENILREIQIKVND